VSKLMIRTIPFLFLLLLANVKQASAQGGSVYFGGGSAWDRAGTSPGCPSGNLFDGFTGNCEPGPTMGGAFGVFGADYMFRPHFGVGGEYAFRFAQAPFLPAVGLNMRPSFFDFNAIWQPAAGSNSRVVPVLEGGIGDARVALYITQQCNITGINCTSSTPAGFNANHFQVHVGAGVKLYIKGGIFIKPQFDFHYVPNLTDQFAHNYVPQATVSIGYTFGDH
jgi:hypothetical protein